MFNLPNQHRNNRKEVKICIFRIAPTYSLALFGSGLAKGLATNLFYDRKDSEVLPQCDTSVSAMSVTAAPRSRIVASELTYLGIQYPGTTRRNPRGFVVAMPHRKQTRCDLLHDSRSSLRRFR